MKIFTLTDSREIDRFPTMKLFVNEKDAIEMKNSFKNESNYWDIHWEETF